MQLNSGNNVLALELLTMWFTLSVVDQQFQQQFQLQLQQLIHCQLINTGTSPWTIVTPLCTTK